MELHKNVQLINHPPRTKLNYLPSVVAGGLVEIWNSCGGRNSSTCHVTHVNGTCEVISHMCYSLLAILLYEQTN